MENQQMHYAEWDIIVLNMNRSGMEILYYVNHGGLPKRQFYAPIPLSNDPPMLEKAWYSYKPVACDKVSYKGRWRICRDADKLSDTLFGGETLLMSSICVCLVKWCELV
jgi:hypothetical protein